MDLEQLSSYNITYVTNFQIFSQNNNIYLACGSNIQRLSLNLTSQSNSSQNISVEIKQGITLYTITQDLLGQMTANKTQFILPQNTSNQICQELLQTSSLLICQGIQTQSYYIQKDQIDPDSLQLQLQLKDTFKQNQQLHIIGIKEDIVYIRTPPQKQSDQYQIVGYLIDNQCQLIPKYVFQNQTVIYIDKLINNVKQDDKTYFISQNKDKIIKFSISSQIIQYQFSRSESDEISTVYDVNLMQVDDQFDVQIYAQTGSQALYQSIQNQYNLMVLQNKFYRNQVFFDGNLIIFNILQDELRFTQFISEYFEQENLIYQDLQLDKEEYLPDEVETLSFKIKNSIQCDNIQVVLQNSANIYVNFDQTTDGDMNICQGKMKVPVKAKKYDEYLVFGTQKLNGQQQQLTVVHDQPQNITQAMISPSIIRTNNTFKVRIAISDKYQNRINVQDDSQCQNIFASIYVLNGTNKYSEINLNNTFFYKKIQFKKENNVCIFEDEKYDAQKYAVLVNFNGEIEQQEDKINYQQLSTQIGQSLIFTVSQIPVVFTWGPVQILNIFAYIIFMLFIMILLPYILYYCTEKDNILLRKQEKAQEKAKQQIIINEKKEEQKEKIQGLGKVQINGKELYNNQQYIEKNDQLKDIQLSDNHIKQLLQEQNWIQSKYSKYIYLENCKFKDSACNIHISFPKIDSKVYQDQIIFYQNLNIKLINQKYQEKLYQNQQSKTMLPEQQISQGISSTMPAENCSTESLTNISQQQSLNISNMAASQVISDPTVVDFNTSVTNICYQNVEKIDIQKIIIFNTNDEKDNILVKTLQEISPDQDVVLTIFTHCNQIQQQQLSEETLQQLKQIQSAFHNMRPHRIFEQLQYNLFQSELKTNTIILGVPPAQDEKYLIYGFNE